MRADVWRWLHRHHGGIVKRVSALDGEPQLRVAWLACACGATRKVWP